MDEQQGPSGGPAGAPAGRRAWGLLISMLLLLAVPKVLCSAATGAPGIDGGYYADIAAGVRDGRGLVTDVSLLHKGYPEFPYPTDVYPLWPLLYGLTARVFPLVPAGVWLATALYFATLVLGYLWATRVWPEPFFSRVPLNAGHVTVLVLGLARSFFEMTSLPYTEGLAFTLLMASLWRAHALLPQRTVRAGLELGAWAGLLVLARTQMVLFLVAIVATVLVALVVQPQRRRTAAFGVAVAGAFALMLMPEYLHLRSFVPDATPLHIFRFEKTQATDVLTPYTVIVPASSALDYALDRAAGFAVAFAPRWSGYWSQFSVFTYAPLLAAVPFALGLRRRWRDAGLRRALAWLAEPRALTVGFLALFVAGAFIAIHLMHKAPDAWYFHRRHALTSAFLLIAAMVFLLRGWRPLRLAALALLVVGVVLGGRNVARATATAATRAYAPPEALVRWIEEEKERTPNLVLVMRRPQVIAWRTGGVGYHWFDDNTATADVAAMVDELGASAVLMPPRMRLERAIAFRRRFALDGEVAGHRIYRPRAHALADPPPAPSADAAPSALDGPAPVDAVDEE